MSVNKTADSDLEYKYEGDELGATHSEATADLDAPKNPAPEKAKKRFFSRKKIFISITAIIILGGIYQFLSQRDKIAAEGNQGEIERITQAKSKEQPPAKPVVKKEAPITPAQEQVKPKAPVASVPPIAKPVENTEIFSSMSAITENRIANNKNEQEIKVLKTELKQANQSMDNLQNSLQTLTASVQVLSTQVQLLTAAQIKASVVPVAKAKPEEKPVYFVKSLIQGRAWLETGDGKLITVKVGDELMGYGKVTAISVEDGLVKTSSKTDIKYGPNDS